MTDPWFFYALCALIGFLFLIGASLFRPAYSLTELGVYFFAGFLFLLGFWPLWKNGLLQSNWFWAALFVSFIGLYWAAEEAFGIILDRAEKRARDKLKEKEKKG